MKNVWLPVSVRSFPVTGYEVSQAGQVRRSIRAVDGNVIGTEPVPTEASANGSLMVRLPPDQSVSTVARLVAEAFLGVVGSEWYFLFRDGNPGNCCLDNIQPVNRAFMATEAKALMGVSTRTWRLSPSQVRAIRQDYRAGVPVWRISSKYEVTNGMARRIGSGASYASIPDAPQVTATGRNVELSQ